MWYSAGMKPYPRIRKAIKWSGAAVTVLLLLVWVGSGWVYVRHFRSDGSGIFPQQGILIFSKGTWSSALFPPGWRAGIGSFCFKWGFSLPDSGNTWIWRFPLGILVIPIAAAASVAWRLDTLARRHAKGG